MDDELGQGLELETATPEPAGIGEERSSGDAGHVGVSCIHRGCGSWGGCEEETGFGVRGVGERGRAENGGADTGGQTGQRRTQLGRQAGQWGWGMAGAQEGRMM